jgi:SAM-dependent methyltransferase
VVSPAVKKTVEFFRPGVDYSLREADGDYVDVLGSTDVIAPRASHQVVQKKNFPRIYERIWRPIVSRGFFGPFGMGPRKERRVTLAMLNVSPGDRVLDVGCGPGNYTRYLAEASGNGLVVGADASGPMLAAGVRQGGGSNLAYVRADACALPFADGEFDVVSCIGTLHMTQAPMTALAEMVRVLAPGGRIGIVTTCGRRGAGSRLRSGITVFARDEMPEALRGHGLVGVEQRVVWRAQFVAADRLEGDRVGR